MGNSRNKTKKLSAFKRKQISSGISKQKDILPKYVPISVVQCENSIESEDELYVEADQQTKNNFECIGRRIVDLSYIFKQLKEAKHNAMFSCGLGETNLISEKRHGLFTTFTFKCEMCMNEFTIRSEKPDDADRVSINIAAVTGIVATGIGYTQFEELMAAIDIPIFCTKFFSNTQNWTFDKWEELALEVMQKAAEEERQLAIQDGKVENGIPIIDVYADGAWSKRSYGSNYNALSGVASIIGRKTGKILYIGIKNKFCIVCARATTKGEIAIDHKCYKNYEGASSSMESDIICDGFKDSLNSHGLIYGRFIADGDSSTYSKILSANPYPGYTVSKIECRNHILRNFCNKLRALSKDTRYPNAQRKFLKNDKIFKMRKVIVASISHNKNSDVNNVHADIVNSLNHAYGDHSICKPYYCNQNKSLDLSEIVQIENSPFWFRQKVIISNLAAKSKSLSEDVDTNTVERFNSVIAKFIGGKRINFSSRRSYQSRCFAAVVSFNDKKTFYSLHKKFLCKSPKNLIKKLEQKKVNNRLKANKFKRNKVRRKLFPKQNDYGSAVMAEDMTAHQYDQAKTEFLKNLNIMVRDRNGLEQRTKLQRECREWLEVRKQLITASNFGNIVKRQKNFGKLAENILYKKNISSVASVAHGMDNEKFALAQLSVQENVHIRECGLFVDEQYPFVGATPDGIIGDDTIVEIKCNVAAYKVGLKKAIEQNKVQILKYNKKNQTISVNKNCNWYYQVQGQLRVTQKSKCILAVWGNEKERLEIVHIERDDEFWKTKMEKKITDFYMNHILPELVDSRKNRGMPLRSDIP